MARVSSSVSANLMSRRKVTPPAKVPVAVGDRVPRLLHHCTISRLWFAKNPPLTDPSVNVMVLVSSPVCRRGTRESNLHTLLVHVLDGVLSDYLEYASDSGVSCTISETPLGFEMFARGQEGSVLHHANHVLSTLVNFEVADNLYEESKRVIMEISERVAKFPMYIINLLMDDLWTAKEKFEDFSNFSYSRTDLESFAQEFLSYLKVEWYIWGNVKQSEAELAYIMGMKPFVAFGSKKPPPWKLIRPRQLILHTGSSTVYEEHNADSIGVSILLQVGPCGIGSRTILSIVWGLIQAELCRFLEEENQLSVTYFNVGWKGSGSTYLELHVKSEVEDKGHDPFIVDGRINRCFTMLSIYLDNLTQSEFEKYRTDQIATVNEIEETLSDMEVEIQDQTYNFRVRQYFLEQLESITLETIRDFYKEWLTPDAPKLKRLAVYQYKRPKKLEWRDSSSIPENHQGSSAVDKNLDYYETRYPRRNSIYDKMANASINKLQAGLTKTESLPPSNIPNPNLGGSGSEIQNILKKKLSKGNQSVSQRVMKVSPHLSYPVTDVEKGRSGQAQSKQRIHIIRDVSEWKRSMEFYPSSDLFIDEHWIRS